VREGDLAAVRSFANSEGKDVFSILELVSVLPAHYALGTSSAEAEKAFPGFFLEAAKSARVDWEQKEPTEQTTKIRAEAIPTGIQLVFDSKNQPATSPDESLPMVGEEAHLLSDDLTNQIINKGLLSGSGILTISPCNLVLNPAVEVMISLEDLLRTHFGVFGFTGSGKSNLMSTVVADIVHRSNETKIVLIDLMAEYTALLVDQIDTMPTAYILAVGEDSLPGGEPTAAYLRGNRASENAAVESIVRTLLLPRDLNPHRSEFTESIRRILQAGKIRLFDLGVRAIDAGELEAAIKDKIDHRAGVTATLLETWIETRVTDRPTFSRDDIEHLIEELEGFESQGVPTNFLPRGPTETPQQSTLQGRRAPVVAATTERQNLPITSRAAVGSMKSYLRRLLGAETEDFPESAKLSIMDLRRLLETTGSPVLVIIQSNRNDQLRTTAATVIESVYNNRRRFGRIAPPILFAFDEADEFIPQSSVGSGSSYDASRDAITTLARRGRKFGLGMGIATQRVTYLDTSILAQPHTYFVSKLPRRTDRERMAEAFGLLEDMMRKTLKFTKGQWLLVSFDATGLVNVPLPVHLRNANDRVLEHFRRRKVDQA
jgi:DNA helicase HerA-like ATPase